MLIQKCLFNRKIIISYLKYYFAQSKQYYKTWKSHYWSCTTFDVRPAVAWFIFYCPSHLNLYCQLMLRNHNTHNTRIDRVELTIKWCIIFLLLFLQNIGPAYWQITFFTHLEINLQGVFYHVIISLSLHIRF